MIVKVVIANQLNRDTTSSYREFPLDYSIGDSIRETIKYLPQSRESYSPLSIIRWLLLKFVVVPASLARTEHSKIIKIE